MIFNQVRNIILFAKMHRANIAPESMLRHRGPQLKQQSTHVTRLKWLIDRQWQRWRRQGGCRDGRAVLLPLQLIVV